MDKTYRYRSGTISVTLPKSCDREELARVTEEFLKKVISEGNKHGNFNTSRNFRKE